MATLKKSKLDAVIQHIKDGGSDDFESIATLVEVADEETVEAYVRKAKKDMVGEAPVSDAPVLYQLRDSSGVLKDLGVVRQKGNLVILEHPVVRDMVTLLIKGGEETVDLEELRKLSPDALHLGVKVSTLIAAAELAKG